MRRSVVLTTAIAAACAVFLTGCGEGTSGNVDVALIDTSKSFCQALPKLPEQDRRAIVDDSLTIFPNAAAYSDYF